jgi:hypothetical protein
MTMDLAKLFDLAERLDLPELLVQGAAFLAAVRENAALARDVLSDGDWAQIEAIHARAMAAAERLDTDLAAAAAR